MKKSLNFILCFAVSLAISVIFLKYRKAGYYTIPGTKIFDERNYVFQGISVRKNGIPIAWSDILEYNKKLETTKNKGLEFEEFSISVDKKIPNIKNYKDFPKPILLVKEFNFGDGMQHLRLVQPFLDHPPLGGLIYSLTVNKDIKTLEEVRPEDYRKLPIYLAVLNSLLIFTLAFIISKNPWISTLSVAIYNSVPSYFIASRYALLENIVSPISLIFMNLLAIFLEIEKRSRRISNMLICIAGLFAGLAVLAKESGIAFIITGIIILIYQRITLRKIIIFAVSASTPIIIYLIWGNWIAGKLFWEIILANSQRNFIGSLNFINILTYQWSDKIKFDGWWIWGFLSAGITTLVIKKQKQKNLLVIPIATSLSTIMFLAGLNYPWYYFFLIPYLSIASAYTIWFIIKKEKTPITLAFLLIPFSSSLYWGHQVLNEYPNKLEYRIFIIAISTILLIKLFFKKKSSTLSTVWKIFFILIITIALELNRRSIIYLLSNWGDTKFPIMPHTE